MTRRSLGLLFLLVLAALALRAPRLDWGLPEVHEEATPVREAVEFWGEPGGTLDLNPHFFKYPSLTFYLHFAVQSGWYFGRSLSGSTESLNDFRQFLDQDFDRVILLARRLQSLLGALVVIPVFVLGRRLAGSAAGWTGALLAGVLPTLVTESRVVGPDIALALFSASALAATAGVVTLGRRSDYLWAGLFIGLAVSAKYPGALLGVALLTAHMVRCRREGIPILGLIPVLEAGTVALMAFVITSPFVVLNPGAFLADFRFEREHMLQGHLGREEGRALFHYLGSVLPRAWTLPGALVALLGLGVALTRKSLRSAALPGAVFAATLLLVLGSWTMAADRYALPLAPLAAAWIGVLVATLTSRVTRLHARPWVAGGLALLLSLPMISASVHQVREAGRDDSRLMAEAWIRERIPAGDMILLERYGPKVDPGIYPVLHLPFHGVEPHLYDPAYSPVLYGSFDWLVLSSGVHARYLAHPREYPAQVAFYESLGRGFREVTRFSAGEYFGPTVIVLQRREDGDLGSLEGIPEEFFDDLEGNRVLAEYFSQLGAVLVRGGETDRGFLMLRRAVEVDGTSVATWGNLGAMHLREGRFEEALTAFRRALNLDPEDGQIHYNLATLHRLDGEIAQAIDEYQRALATRPDLEDAWIGLARVLVEKGRYAEARQVLSEFLDRFPRSSRRASAETALGELRLLGPGRRP